MSATPWLASACPAAVPALLKLPREKAARAEALFATREPGSAVLGNRADVPSHGTTAYCLVLTDRPMGDEQINRTANGGVQGPQYAWREPVTT